VVSNIIMQQIDAIAFSFIRNQNPLSFQFTGYIVVLSKIAFVGKSASPSNS